MMNDYVAEIKEILERKTTNNVGSMTFATGGMIDPATIRIPAVVVHNVGRIAYPLWPQQAAALIAIATQAPFGKGTETVVDLEVRRTWQIEPAQVTIRQDWLSNSLPKLVASCCEDLGVDYKRLQVEAHFYKLLLYEEGGHFLKHRDTEKEPGMFGSLLVQLPAEHEGGVLVVEHAGKEKRFEFAKDSGDCAFYSAFYADCEHVLEPVTKGFRLVLAFNLVRHPASLSSSSSSASIASALKQEVDLDQALANACRAWCDDESGVEKLVSPMSFKYTETNLSFNGLKGEDINMVQTLRNAVNPSTNERLFSVYLALVTKHVTGAGMDNFGYDGCDDKMDPGCDITTKYETDSWVGVDGSQDVKQLQIDFYRELLDPDEEGEFTNIFDEEPDDVDNEGYCGNYAGTVEYWYHSAVIVFWPAQRDFEMRLQSGPIAALSALESLDRSSTLFTSSFTKYLDNCCKKPEWISNFQFERVVPMISTLEQARQVIALIKSTKLVPKFQVLIDLILKFSLSAMYKDVLALLETQTLEQMIIVAKSIRDALVGSNSDLKALVSVVVKKCLGTFAESKSVLDTLNFVVEENAYNLVASFKPKVVNTSISSGFFKGLTKFGAVIAALKGRSPMGDSLRALIQDRIKIMAPKAAESIMPFSWCMLGVANPTNDARVAEFLASSRQEITLSGFGGIVAARKWATTYFGTGTGMIHHINTNCTGSGPRAVVVLTKTSGLHMATVRNIKESAAEVQMLNDLMKLCQPTSIVDSCKVAGESNDSSMNALGNEIPPYKKSKTDSLQHQHSSSCSNSSSSSNCSSNSAKKVIEIIEIE